mgnify:CR=1 FL=1
MAKASEADPYPGMALDLLAVAMAGFSMGGFQTFQVTLNHLDLFTHIGGFSGAMGLLSRGESSRYIARHLSYREGTMRVYLHEL